MVTDDLKRKLANCNGKIKEIERERAERRKIRKKTKVVADSPGPSTSQAETTSSGDAPSGDAIMSDATPVAAGELEDENVTREKEKETFEATIDSDLKADTGASVTGLFELCGKSFALSLLGKVGPISTILAIVTHKGPSADSGHYIGFVKKDRFHSPKSYLEEGDEDCECRCVHLGKKSDTECNHQGTNLMTKRFRLSLKKKY